MIFEDLEILEQNVFPMGNHLLPVFFLRLLQGRGHEAKIFRPSVGAHIKAVLVVVDVVLVFPFPGPEELEPPFRIIGIQIPVLVAERLS